MRYFKYNIFGLNVNILGEIKKPALKKCSCKSVAMFGNVMAMLWQCSAMFGIMSFR